MYRGSHLPALMKLVPMTTGPILEMGCGMFSTPFLHWTCYQTGRRLVTYESDPKYFNDVLTGVQENLRNAHQEFHTVGLVTDWDAVDLSPAWSIAFVDHSPDRRRYLDLKRLTHAEYVVVHDTEPRRNNWRKHHWGEAFGLFKYRFQYDKALPETTILSNVHDVAGFTIP